MISKKDLKEYDFISIVNYYNHIIESKVNGQNTQCISLIKEMSKSQNITFLKYLKSHKDELSIEDIDSLEEFIAKYVFII